VKLGIFTQPDVDAIPAAYAKTELVVKSFVTAGHLVGRFSYRNNCQRSSFREDTIIRTATDALQMYGQLLPVGAVDCWPLPFVFGKTIRLTTTATTVTLAAVVTDISKAPLAITWTPLAIPQSAAVVLPRANTIAPLTTPKSNLCHRPNCKSRRCRRRQTVAAEKAANFLKR
jgi:hypothetical protein